MFRKSIALCSLLVLVAISLGLLGAAAADRDPSSPGRYDASIMATTGDLVVVDHHTNKLHVYGQHDGSWVLRSSTDLMQVGQVKIEPQRPPKDLLDKALGREDG